MKGRREGKEMAHPSWRRAKEERKEDTSKHEKIERFQKKKKNYLIGKMPKMWSIVCVPEKPVINGSMPVWHEPKGKNKNQLTVGSAPS